MDMDLKKDFYSVMECACATGVSYSAILEDIHSGKIRYVKFGRLYRIPRAALMDYIKLRKS